MNYLEKKVVYVDMDFTLCDFGASYLQYKQQHPEEAFPHSVPGVASSILAGRANFFKIPGIS